MYIAFEGIDGCGKSTMASALVAALTEGGHLVKRVWEPGSTPVAEAIRTLVKSKDLEESMMPVTELFLLNGARHQTLHNVVKPALDAGKIVISDRCYLSGRAYQGYGRNMLLQSNTLEAFIPESLKPDLIIYLDVDVETGLRRTEERDETDRIEEAGLDFFRRARDGFRTAAKMEPERVVRVNANREVEAVFMDVLTHVRRLMEMRNIRWHKETADAS